MGRSNIVTEKYSFSVIFGKLVLVTRSTGVINENVSVGRVK